MAWMKRKIEEKSLLVVGVRVRWQRPASESRPYKCRFCRVARLAASTCGDLAKRARYIVRLLVLRNCVKTKKDSTISRHDGEGDADGRYGKIK